MTKVLKIFLDDERTSRDQWITVRTVQQAIDLIEGHDGNYMISLDHDLGGDLTSREIIFWMIENNKHPIAADSHSANPVGRAWLEAALQYDFPQPIPPIPFEDKPEWIVY